jgi:hypothetical protein
MSSHIPPPPCKQLCTRSCSNKHTLTEGKFRLMVGILSATINYRLHGVPKVALSSLRLPSCSGGRRIDCQFAYPLPDDYIRPRSCPGATGRECVISRNVCRNLVFASSRRHCASSHSDLGEKKRARALFPAGTNWLQLQARVRFLVS